MFFLPRAEVLENLNHLKKNGIDTLLLAGSQATEGRIRNTNPGKIGRVVSWTYRQAQNGLKRLIDIGVASWDCDDLLFAGMKYMFDRGKGGFFAVHNVFSSEKFIKEINEVPKRLAVRILGTGIGSRAHKKAFKGLIFNTNTLMYWAGVDRPWKLAAALEILEPYFIIVNYKDLGKYSIRIRPEYLAVKRQVNNYHATWADLYHVLNQHKYFIDSKDVLQDVLTLFRRYGQAKIEYALHEAQYVWQRVSNLAGYLHTIILENCGQMKNYPGRYVG